MSTTPDEAQVGQRVAGLSLRESYVDAAQESRLVSAIDAEPWNDAWRRRRQLYGKRYDQTPTRPFPPFLEALSTRLVKEKLLPSVPIGGVINEYLPGQGIAPHLDRFYFGGVVVSLSLLSDITLDLHDGERTQSIDLPRRSLLRLSEEARWVWTHGIAPRFTDQIGGLRRPRGRRISITLRIDRSPGDPPSPGRQG